MAQVFGNLEDLNALMGGMVRERYMDALDRLGKNIADPNTDPKKTRKIVMTLTVKPNERRDGGEMFFSVDERLAPPVPVSQAIFFTRADDGSVYATQRLDQIPGQVDMEGEITPEPVTVALSPAQAENKENEQQKSGANVLSFK